MPYCCYTAKDWKHWVLFCFFILKINWMFYFVSVPDFLPIHDSLTLSGPRVKSYSTLWVSQPWCHTTVICPPSSNQNFEAQHRNFTLKTEQTMWSQPYGVRLGTCIIIQTLFNKRNKEWDGQLRISFSQRGPQMFHDESSIQGPWFQTK